MYGLKVDLRFSKIRMNAYILVLLKLSNVIGESPCTVPATVVLYAVAFTRKI